MFSMRNTDNYLIWNTFFGIELFSGVIMCGIYAGAIWYDWYQSLKTAHEQSHEQKIKNRMNNKQSRVHHKQEVTLENAKQ